MRNACKAERDTTDLHIMIPDAESDIADLHIMISTFIKLSERGLPPCNAPRSFHINEEEHKERTTKTWRLSVCDKILP